MDHWAGALLLERTLTAMSAGFNAMHFMRELWRLRGGDGDWMGGRARKVRARRAALAGMAAVNAALASGALYTMASERFALVAGLAGLEAVTVAVALAASLFMTALVMRAKQ